MSTKFSRNIKKCKLRLVTDSAKNGIEFLRLLMLVINRQWSRKVIETKATLFAIEHYFFLFRNTNREISIEKWATREMNRVLWNFSKDAMSSSQVDQVNESSNRILEFLKKN